MEDALCKVESLNLDLILKNYEAELRDSKRIRENVGVESYLSKNNIRLHKHSDILSLAQVDSDMYRALSKTYIELIMSNHGEHMILRNKINGHWVKNKGKNLSKLIDLGFKPSSVDVVTSEYLFINSDQIIPFDTKNPDLSTEFWFEDNNEPGFPVKK